MMRNIGAGCIVIAVAVLLVFQLAEASAYKPEYKLSLVVGPKGPWGEGAQKFADLVRERTAGRINIKV